jgi:hypothetical protein
MRFLVSKDASYVTGQAMQVTVSGPVSLRSDFAHVRAETGCRKVDTRLVATTGIRAGVRWLP